MCIRDRVNAPVGGRCITAVPRDRPPVRAAYVNAGNRCNFVPELPAGRAVVLPINGSVCAVGRQAPAMPTGRRSRDAAAGGTQRGSAVERGVIGMIVSLPLFEAYLECRTKCWLRSRAEPSTGNLYAEWCQRAGSVNVALSMLVVGMVASR